jgi:regulator of replication initiation timing
MRKMIEDSEEQKKEVGEVDDKMNEIKGNIEELIEQSNVLKVKNSELEKKISQKNKINETKEKEMEDLQQ